MLSETSQAIVFYAFFVASKVGKAGLTVEVDVRRGTTQIVTDGAAEAVGGGLYRYSLAGASTGDAESYIAVFKTADATVDHQHIPALWIVGTNHAPAQVKGIDDAALLDKADGIEAGLTLRQWLRLGAAVLFGKSSAGGGTYRDTNDTKDRIVATLDADGNRTAITRDDT